MSHSPGCGAPSTYRRSEGCRPVEENKITIRIATRNKAKSCFNSFLFVWMDFWELIGEDAVLSLECPSKTRDKPRLQGVLEHPDVGEHAFGQVLLRL